MDGVVEDVVADAVVVDAVVVDVTVVGPGCDLMSPQLRMSLCV